MTNRFERLYQLPENQYIKDSPIILAAGALLKDTETGSIIAQLKFQSVSVKLIKAVKVSLVAYDISGAEIQGVSDYQYLELNVINGQEFGGNKAIVLPNSVTRSLAVTSTIVVFDDGTMWENSAQFSMLPTALPLSFEDVELEKQYRIATNNHAKYRPCKDKGLWQCSCGKWNSGEACTHCRLTCDKAFSALNIPLLTEQKNARLAAKAEQERIAAEEKYKKKQQQNERARKVGSIAFKVFLVALVATALVYFSSDSARRAEGTDYACNKGKSASWYWWLRSANNIEYAGFVSEGELGYGEEVDRNMGIRPAMWIEITE